MHGGWRSNLTIDGNPSMVMEIHSGSWPVGDVVGEYIANMYPQLVCMTANSVDITQNCTRNGS